MDAKPKCSIDPMDLMQLQIFQACGVLHALLEDSADSPTKYRAAETLLRMAATVAENPTPEGFDLAIHRLLAETAMYEAELQGQRH